MPNLSGIVKQLKIERDRVQQQLTGLNAALAAFGRVYRTGTKSVGNASKGKRRSISAKGRAAISRAQKARWAKQNSKSQASVSGKRTMSASARKKIAAAQKARWAKLKAGKKVA
jgi:hypothetical protein